MESDPIKRWRDRAEECRAFAEDCEFSWHARDAFLTVAAQYEMLISRALAAAAITSAWLPSKRQKS